MATIIFDTNCPTAKYLVVRRPIQCFTHGLPLILEHVRESFKVECHRTPCNLSVGEDSIEILAEVVSLVKCMLRRRWSIPTTYFINFSAALRDVQKHNLVAGFVSSKSRGSATPEKQNVAIKLRQNVAIKLRLNSMKVAMTCGRIKRFQRKVAVFYHSTL